MNELIKRKQIPVVNMDRVYVRIFERDLLSSKRISKSHLTHQVMSNYLMRHNIPGMNESIEGMKFWQEKTQTVSWMGMARYFNKV